MARAHPALGWHKLPFLMIGTYASAALICAASLLVGRAVLALAGRRSWSWLEPAVGLAAVLTVTGVLARGARPRDERNPRRGRTRDRRCAARLVASLRGARSAANGMAGGVRRRPCARDPVCRQRSLGLARRRLQQRSRAAPGLGRVPAQRLRADAGGRLPAGPARAGGGDCGRPGDRPGTGVRRRDRRDRRPHRPDRARRPARADARAPGPRRDHGPPHLPRRLLLRPGRLQGDRRGALRPRLRDRPLRLRPPTGRKRPNDGRFRPIGGLLGVGAVGAAGVGAGGRDLFLVQLCGGGLAGCDLRSLEPYPAGGAAGAAAAGAAALSVAAAHPAHDRRARRPGGGGDDRRALRLRPRLQQGRRQQHLRPGLAARDPGDLAGGELPPRRRRRRPVAGPRGGDREPGAAGRRRLVGTATRAGDPGRARRLRRPLPRLPPLQRRLLTSQGPDDRRPPRDAPHDPPPPHRNPRPMGR